MANTSETGRKGVEVYRAADAPSLDESGATKFDFGDNDYLMEMAVKLAGSDCSVSKLLYHNDAEGGLAIAYLFFKPNYPLFRHAHDVDTLYVVISGSVVDFMGDETLRPGDIWAVKKGNSYWYSAGPDGVEVLEMFQAAGTTTIIMTENPPERLEQAQAAVRDNEQAWRQIPEGPLFVANRG
jgi:mannose-6-phosphate isomerase-like protein (cupin superfamily)